jgi:hypothetical protein
MDCWSEKRAPLSETVVSWSETGVPRGETEGVWSEKRPSLSELVINIRTRTVKTDIIQTYGAERSPTADWQACNRTFTHNNFLKNKLKRKGENMTLSNIFSFLRIKGERS